MKLHLVRHAIAEEVRADLEDADRELTREGRKRMRRAVAGLAAIGVELDRVLTSPLRRARGTAEILAAGLGDVDIEIFDPLAPPADPRAILRALEERPGLDAIALVGHEPDLGRLAARLLGRGTTGAAVPFRKGGVARFDWQPDRAPASLEWWLPPRLLRRLARR